MAKLELLTRLLEKVDRILLAVKQQRRKHEIATLERELQPAIAQAFKAQGAAFGANLGKLRDKPPEMWTEKDWLPLLEEAQRDTAPLFAEPWRDTVGQAILQGAALTADEVGVKLVSEPSPVDVATVAIKFGLKNPRAVEYLLHEGAKLITNIDEVTRDVIRGILARGVSEGWSYNQMAQAIIEQFAEFAEGRPQEHIDSRAHGVAVTEVGNAYSYGNWCTGQELKDQGLSVEKKWDTMGDERICDICGGNEAQGWIPFDDEFQSTDIRPLAHPYCLPSGELATAHGIVAVTQRFYNGELVIVNTARGNRLSCTPNHPVLTPHGWVGAGQLNEGDEVFAGDFCKRVSRFTDVDNVDVPTRIEQIVDAFRGSGQVTAREVKVAAPDFHGDGSGSDIAVIWADSALRYEVDPDGGEVVLQPVFVGSDVGGIGLPGESHAETPFQRGAASLDGSMSGEGVAGVFVGRPGSHHQAVGLQVAAPFYTGGQQSPGDSPAVNVVEVGEGVFRLTRNVAADQLGNGNIDGMATLTTDRVVGIERRAFIGHVYNLQTECGYYITSGLVVSNCRCDMLLRVAPGAK